MHDKYDSQEVARENVARTRREIAEIIAKQQRSKNKFSGQQKLFLMSLIDVRSRKKLSQIQLAAKLGWPQSTVARIESGHGNPTLKTVLAIAAALDVSLVLE